MECATASRPAGADPGLTDIQRALDNWLRRSLDDAYGTVPDEHLPPDWLTMIEATRLD